MEFNLDDPLGDILSEGSNDSFFEVGAKSKKPPITQSTPKQSTSTVSTGKFEDLFGIKETTTKDVPTKQLEPVQLKSIDKPAKINLTSSQTKSTNLFGEDDLLLDLGFDPKKPKAVKTNILDDILGPMESKKPAPVAPSRPHTSGGILKDESKGISRQSTETTESTKAGGSVVSASRPKTSAGPRQSTASSNDPLGLFGPSAKDSAQTKEVRETPRPARRKATAADWLGLEPDNKDEPDIATSTQPKDQMHPTQVLTVHDTQQAFVPNIPQVNLQQVFNPNANNLLFTASALESQNALQALQQQEAQVLLANQMKSQEVALVEMQQRQQQLLAQQEAQFNNLVQKQLVRQSQLEATIRAQQERINAHIQMLMSQPHMATSNAPDFSGDSVTVTRSKEAKENGGELEDVELRAEVKRLELEKLRLEDLISNVNANHEKELEFMETSHRKQIQVLEDNYQNSESRLKDEIRNIEEHYRKKLQTSDSEKQHLIETYETKFKNLSAEHAEAVKLLKENYRAELENVRSEHKNMIENIRQSKLLEFAVVQDNTSYLQTLKSASSNLENVSGNLQTLRDELYSKIDTAHRERESKLEGRERIIEDKERHIKIIEETAEEERTRLMNLVASLETQLAKLSKETSEEQWTVRQKITTLEIERNAFEREKQFAKEQLQREEKHIEELKQNQLDEYKRLMQQIQDEKQHINIEKAKLEAAKKLQANVNNDQLKSEAEAALKVAQDAARQADQERERYLAMQRQLEMTKRELVDQENGLRQKQDELESMMYAAKAKDRRNQEALHRMRQAEQNYNEKLQVLQYQIRQTSQREAEISQERVELSRQRFELQEFRKRLELTKCSLCRIGERNNELSQILTRDPNRDGAMGVSVAQPPATVNFGYFGYTPNAIDQMFDNDLTECLRRMQRKEPEVALTADFDYEFQDSNIPRSAAVEARTHTVPTQTFDTGLLETTKDSQQGNQE